MRNSILVLEESSMVHDLFKSALPSDFREWRIDHESKPDRYVKKARETQPTIILLSNRDQNNDYEIANKLRSYPDLNDAPILLLTAAKDQLDEKKLQGIGIQGFIRKPFESITLQKQIKAALRNFRAENANEELDELNIIDDELLGLLSGKTQRDIAMDNLEEELDPTLQLHPIEAGSILEEDEDIERIEDYDEEDIDQIDHYDDDDGFIDDDSETTDTDIDDDEFDTEDLSDDISPSSYDDPETEAIEIELEEISLDFDEIEEEEVSSDVEKTDQPDMVQKIHLVHSDAPLPSSYITNASDSDFVGYMEIALISTDHSVEFETTASPNDDLDSMEDMTLFGDDSDDVFEIELEESDPDESDDFGFTELNISFDNTEQSLSVGSTENINSSDTDDEAYTELDVYLEDDDVIEIEHSDISDDIEGIDEPEMFDDFDESELTDILVEGIDDIDDDDAPEFEPTIDSTTDESTHSDVLEIDFDSEVVEEGDANELSSDDDELEDEIDQLSLSDVVDDITSEFSLDDDDLDGGGLDIQEMINLRQVRKAQYDIAIDSDDDSPFEDETDMDEDDDSPFVDDTGTDEIDEGDDGSTHDTMDEFISETQVEETSSSDGFETDMEDDIDLLEDSDDIFDLTDEEDAIGESEEDNEHDIFADAEPADAEEDDLLLMPEDDDEEESESSELLIDDYSEVEPLEDFDLEEVTIEGLEEKDEGEADELDLLEEDDSDELLEMDTEDDDMEMELSPLEDLPDIEPLDEDPEEIDLAEDMPAEGTANVDLSLSLEEENTFSDSEDETAELLMLDEDTAIEDDFYDVDDEATLEEDVEFDDASDPFEDYAEIDEDIDVGNEFSDESETLTDEYEFDSESDSSGDEMDDDIDLLTNELPEIDDDEITAVFDDETTIEAIEDPTEVALEQEDDLSEVDEFLSDTEAEDIDLIDASETIEMEGPSQSAYADTIDDPFSEPDSPFSEDLEIEETVDEDITLNDDIDMSSQSSDDTPTTDDFSMIDDVTIEVPSDVFEVGDFKMETVTDNTINEPEQESFDDELTENAPLPSLDEDLPDLPSISSETNDATGDDDLLTDTIDTEMSSETDDPFFVESVDEDSFEEDTMPDGTGDDANEPAPSPPAGKSLNDDEKALLSQSTELKEKLSTMIEGMLSETIQSALHDMLPDMMEKIIHEELD